jgi:hypothetical protein
MTLLVDPMNCFFAGNGEEHGRNEKYDKTKQEKVQRDSPGHRRLPERTIAFYVIPNFHYHPPNLSATTDTVWIIKDTLLHTQRGRWSGGLRINYVVLRIFFFGWRFTTLLGPNARSKIRAVLE